MLHYHYLCHIYIPKRTAKQTVKQTCTFQTSATHKKIIMVDSTNITTHCHVDCIYSCCLWHLVFRRSYHCFLEHL